MTTEYLDTVSELYQTTAKNCQKIGKNYVETCEQIFQEASELNATVLDALKAKASKVTNTKDFPSFVSHQAELGQEFVQQYLKTAQSCAEILAGFGKDVQELFEANIKTANNNFGATASKKKKA